LEEVCGTMNGAPKTAKRLFRPIGLTAMGQFLQVMDEAVE
jgi:hypothetical protein